MYTLYIPRLLKVGDKIASTELHLQKDRTRDHFKDHQLGDIRVKLSGAQGLVSKLGVYVSMTLSSIMFSCPYVTVSFSFSSLLPLRSDAGGNRAGNLVFFQDTDCK